MKMSAFIFVTFIIPLLAKADAPQGTTTVYASPNGIQEACVILPDIPGGEYSEKDRRRATKNCSVDLYEGINVALCPKTWSTSAAIMVYDIKDMNMSASDYETRYCKGKSKPDEVSTLFKFKFTMNQHDTSGTLSQSPLMYYHFSRYFGTQIDTPIAVYREIDPQTFLERVAEKGYRQAQGDMIRAAWGYILRAIKNPNTYKPTDDLFVSDRTKMYGVAAKDIGERYGTEFNGTLTGANYDEQNRQFQETAAFRALRVDGDLKTSLDKGLALARQNSHLAKDLKNVSDLQMVFWMREVTEIAVLDYIMSQQDRVGNIDYVWYWYWVENGQVKSQEEKSELPRQKISSIPVPAEIAGLKPVLVQRTHIGDNDAGVRVEYANFAKRSRQLENLKHFSAKIYTRLLKLDENLQSRGDLYGYLTSNFGLTDAEIERFVKNTNEAANLLKQQCLAGTLRFDLDSPKNYLVNGDNPVTVDCHRPSFE